MAAPAPAPDLAEAVAAMELMAIDPVRAAEMIRVMKRRAALSAALYAALERDAMKPTPLAAWRDAAAWLPRARPAKPLFNRLLAAGAPRAEAPAGAVAKPPLPTPAYPTFSFAGLPLADLELRLISASLKASLTIPVYRAQLLSLDLSHCGIGVEGAETLARGLAGNAGLQRLNLRGNPLTCDGCELILRGLLANFRWLTPEGAGGCEYDRFGRPVQAGRAVPHEDSAAAILDGSVREDDFDGRGCTEDALKLRTLIRLKAELQAEAKRRGGYMKALQGMPEDKDLVDAEREARAPAAWVLPRDTAFRSGVAWALGDAPPTTKQAQDRMAALEVEGLEGEAASGAVLGGQALKEILWAKSVAAKKEAKGIQKLRKMAKKAAGGGGEGGAGEKKGKGRRRSRAGPRYHSPTRLSRVDQLASAEAVSLAQKDAQRARMARELGLGRHANTVKVEEGDVINGRIIWLGDKRISERQLVDYARRWKVPRQAVVGYRLELPVEVSGVSSAVLAARRARDARNRKERTNVDAEVALDRDSDEEVEAAEEAAEAKIAGLAALAETAARVGEGAGAVLAALQAAQEAHAVDNETPSATDTSSGAESVTDAAQRQPFASLELLRGVDDVFATQRAAAFAGLGHGPSATGPPGFAASLTMDRSVGGYRESGEDMIPFLKRIISRQPLASKDAMLERMKKLGLLGAPGKVGAVMGLGGGRRGGEDGESKGSKWEEGEEGEEGSQEESEEEGGEEAEEAAGKGTGKKSAAVDKGEGRVAGAGEGEGAVTAAPSQDGCSGGGGGGEPASAPPEADAFDVNALLERAQAERQSAEAEEAEEERAVAVRRGGGLAGAARPPPSARPPASSVLGAGAGVGGGTGKGAGLDKGYDAEREEEEGEAEDGQPGGATATASASATTRSLTGSGAPALSTDPARLLPTARRPAASDSGSVCSDATGASSQQALSKLER